MPFKKGHIPWNKGFTKEINKKLAKMAEDRKGHNWSWNTGLTKETNPKLKEIGKKISKTSLGRTSWNIGLTKETDLRITKHAKKLKNKKKSKEHKEKLRIAAIIRWQDPEYRKKQIKAILKGLRKRPTSFEKQIINLCKEHNLPFKYVGNGKLIICCKNPDFVEINEKKLLIETYYKYWHPKDYEEQRYKIFNKYGYKTLFLSDNDLINNNWKQICLKKIQEFIKGN